MKVPLQLLIMYNLKPDNNAYFSFKLDTSNHELSSRDYIELDDCCSIEEIVEEIKTWEDLSSLNNIELQYLCSLPQN